MNVQNARKRSPRRPFVLLGAAVLILALLGSAAANEELLRLQQDPGQWVMPNKTYNGWNYSPLDQINRFNVDRLQVDWTLQTGVLDSHEGQPLVVGNTMYLVAPKPHVVYALDLTRDGVIKWSFQPDMPNLEQAITAACCGGQTRGVSYADGRLFFNTLDGQLFALDAESGEVLWRQEVANLDIAETTTTAPLVVHDHIIIGVAGGERGVRGWVAAYDQETGEQQWKYYSMGSNEEMGIGPRFAPFYEIDSRWEEPGLETWYQDSWQRGGGTVWGWWTYDPELDMFYYSTGNCGPWNPDYRRDPATAPDIENYANKYCASLMARDATTGELIWAYSLTPQDQWDLDEPGINPLVDIEIDGEVVPALVKAARNGYYYVFNRATGEILNDPFAFTHNTIIEDVDPETGVVTYNEDMIAYTDVTVEDICPWIAARNWEQDAYSPRTGLHYFTAENRCNESYTVVEGEYVPGEGYTLFESGDTYYGPGGYRTKLVAVDPATNEIEWEVLDEDFRNNDKPVLVTGGDVIFRGHADGTLRAYDATSGEEVWRFRAGAGFSNSPMTYIGPDGRQYLAVISSMGPDDDQVAVDAPADDEARYRRAGSTLYVFSLP